LRNRKGYIEDGETDGYDNEHDVQVARGGINSSQQIPAREPASSWVHD
jgi:hypothetical protein